MSYALVVDNTIQAEAGSLPSSARTLADPGQWITGLPWTPVEVQRSTGWFEVVQAARPADTPTATWERSLTLVAGVPTETWTERNKTQAELDAERRAANAVTLTDQAGDEIDGLLVQIARLKTVIGSGTDTAGTTTLQALKAMSNTNLMTGSSIKALIDLILDITRATKDVARQTVRLAKLETGELDSADSGS